MADMKLFDQTLGVLHKVLNLRQQNQKLITANIANAETPGYRPVRMEFEQDMQRALGTAERAPLPQREALAKAAISSVNGSIVHDAQGPQIGDKNAVNIDQEMVHLAENQLKYEAAVSMMNKKLSLLKYVAADGR